MFKFSRSSLQRWSHFAINTVCFLLLLRCVFCGLMNRHHIYWYVEIYFGAVTADRAAPIPLPSCDKIHSYCWCFGHNRYILVVVIFFVIVCNEKFAHNNNNRTSIGHRNIRLGYGGFVVCSVVFYEENRKKITWLEKICVIKMSFGFYRVHKSMNYFWMNFTFQWFKHPVNII